MHFFNSISNQKAIKVNIWNARSLTESKTQFVVILYVILVQIEITETKYLRVFMPTVVDEAPDP